MLENTKQSRLLNGILLIGGLLSLGFLFKIPQNMVINYLSLFTSIAAIYFLYRITVLYREEDCNGTISYGAAFYYILRLYFLGNIICSLVIWIYTGFINKDYLGFLLELGIKAYEQIGIKVDNASYDMLKQVFTPGLFTFINIFTSIFTAAFWALILAAFVKKNDTTAEA